MFAIFLAQTLSSRCTLTVVAGDERWPAAGVVLGDFVVHPFEDGYPIDPSDAAIAVLVSGELRDAFLRTSGVGRRTSALECRPSPPIAVDLSRCPAGLCRPLDWDPETCGFAGNTYTGATSWLELSLDWTGMRDKLLFTVTRQDGTGRLAWASGRIEARGAGGAPCLASEHQHGALGRADLARATEMIGIWYAEHRERR